MIPILYGANTTTFSNFGIGHLSDAISPHVVEERNGEFTFEMQYPIDGEHFSEIQMRSIIRAKPSPAQDPQAFRVFRISKPINGIVTVSARHVRYDLEGVPVSPFTATGIAQALQKIKQNSLVTNPFTFTTNKTNNQTMTLETPSAALSLLGGVRGSLLDIYGGEYKYQDFQITLLQSRGANNGVVIRYGVDLIDLQQEENCANVFTGVMCFWKSSYDGTLVTGSIQSSGTFDFARVKVVDKSADYENTPTVAQLNQDAADFINNNKVGVPKVSINLRFANLEQTEEYANIRQSVELCDMITVEFEKLGVTAMARIIRTDYDVINEKYISVEIGDSRTSLADTFVAVQTKAESAPTTVEMQQAINVTTAAITGANGGSVRLLDTNGDDLPDTLYIADNPEPYLANKVWRFNYEGWGASQNGYAGPFTMGATFQQGFLAEFITAGYLSADRIKANSIAVSKLSGSIENGDWEIDLDNGTMTLGDLAVSKITGNIENGDWKIDFDNGTLTIGSISANNLTSGTIDASDITVTNLNADNITTGSINGQRITDYSIKSQKIGTGEITGGVDVYGRPTGNLAASSITGGNIDDLTITGSNLADTTLPGDKLMDHTLSDLQMGVGELSTVSLSGGINKSLGYADNFNLATTKGLGQNRYPQNFTAGDIDAFKAFYSGIYNVREQGEVVYDLTAHYHSFEERNGKIYMSTPTGDSDHANFNIADTATYKAAVPASRAVLYCNASNYTDFDTGFDCDMTGASYHYDSGGNSYGRLEIRNSSGTSLKRIRVKMPAGSNVASITSKSTQYDNSDYYYSNGWKLYVHAKDSGGNTLKTDSIDVQFAVDYGASQGSSVSWVQIMSSDYSLANKQVALYCYNAADQLVYSNGNVRITYDDR